MDRAAREAGEADAGGGGEGSGSRGRKATRFPPRGLLTESAVPTGSSSSSGGGSAGLLPRRPLPLAEPPGGAEADGIVAPVRKSSRGSVFAGSGSSKDLSRPLAAAAGEPSSGASTPERVRRAPSSGPRATFGRTTTGPSDPNPTARGLLGPSAADMTRSFSHMQSMPTMGGLVVLC